jgi:hypothetical protein
MAPVQGTTERQGKVPPYLASPVRLYSIRPNPQQRLRKEWLVHMKTILAIVAIVVLVLVLVPAIVLGQIKQSHKYRARAKKREEVDSLVEDL